MVGKMFRLGQQTDMESIGEEFVQGLFRQELSQIVIGQHTAFLPGNQGHLTVDPRRSGSGSKPAGIVGILPYPAAFQDLLQKCSIDAPAVVTDHPNRNHGHPVDMLWLPLGQVGQPAHPHFPIFRRARETVGIECAPDGAGRIFIR